MFGKKKQNTQPNPFKKERLSAEALDHFMEVNNSPKKYDWEYITQDGRTLYFSIIQVALNNELEHFQYLAGQAEPFHSTEPFYIKQPLIEFALLHTDDPTQKVYWTRDSKVMSQFTRILNDFGYLIISEDENKKLWGVRSNLIHPVTHKE